jgi:hypothetical protein
VIFFVTPSAKNVHNRLETEKEMTLLTFEIVSLLVLAVSVPYVLYRKKKALEGF